MYFREKMILTKVQHHNSKSLIFLSKYCSISTKKIFYDVDDDNKKNEYYWIIDINGTEYTGAYCQIASDDWCFYICNANENYYI